MGGDPVAATFTTALQRTGSSVLVSAAGDLDAAAAPFLEQVLNDVQPSADVLLLDVHDVQFMDSAGLLLFLELHRRAQLRVLRVIVVGWQAQPQRVMEAVAGLPPRGGCPPGRGALAGFRRLVQERADRQRESAADPVGATASPGSTTVC
ncbi:STAS domain-containing protein [Streptomyces sp. NPDC048428]|uniref:STAS domain-containing protein n=1 Tax=Streptomyces sp. NPDC048428 TaxID=3154503 RepID=UPI00343D4CA4